MYEKKLIRCLYNIIQKNIFILFIYIFIDLKIIKFYLKVKKKIIN